MLQQLAQISIQVIQNSDAQYTEFSNAVGCCKYAAAWKFMELMMFVRIDWTFYKIDIHEKIFIFNQINIDMNIPSQRILIEVSAWFEQCLINVFQINLIHAACILQDLNYLIFAYYNESQ